MNHRFRRPSGPAPPDTKSWARVTVLGASRVSGDVVVDQQATAASDEEPATVASLDDRAGRTAAFDAFVATERPRLEAVLLAHYGRDLGHEATADALAYAWEHWDRVSAMDNPVGYLYRVAQSATRRHLRWSRKVALPAVPAELAATVDPELPHALAQLSRQQRVAVLLVHAFGWTYDEAAGAMGISVSTLRNHLLRATARLRDLLGEPDA
jgi:DNA-directed RNA polymerase specialized sigma24 family protein